MGKEYIGLDDKFGYWRDTHLRIEGGAVASLHLRFVLDWNYAARENLLDREEKYLKVEEEKLGNSTVQIISSGQITECKKQLFASDQQSRKEHLYSDAVLHTGRCHIQRPLCGGLFRRRCEYYDTLQAGSPVCLLGNVFLYRRPCNGRSQMLYLR